jgi:hypothetical protein
MMRELLGLSSVGRCLAALSTLILVVIAGCGGGTSGADSTADNGTRPSAAATNTAIGQTIEDLIAPWDVSFCVWFTSDGLYFNGPEYFVWRQGKGAQRLDVLLAGSEEPDMGWFSIESDSPPDEALPYSGMDCLWFREGSSEGAGAVEARVSCGAGPDMPTVLFSALWSFVTERLPDQTIAGRRASCYSFDDPDMNVAVFCVDASEGIPLRLSTVGPREYGLTQELEAVSVSTEEQDLHFPLELEENVETHLWQAETTVPISTLDLPDLSAFEE